MRPIDIIELLLGVSWALFSLPFLIFAWSLTMHLFRPLTMEPPTWARAFAFFLLSALYVLSFVALGAAARASLAKSILYWNPMAGGVLIGLVFIAIVSRSKKKKK